MNAYKFENIAVVKNGTTLGFINGNSIAEIKRIVKEDRFFRFRNNGIITICFDDRDSLNVNSNK